MQTPAGDEGNRVESEQVAGNRTNSLSDHRPSAPGAEPPDDGGNPLRSGLPSFLG